MLIIGLTIRHNYPMSSPIKIYTQPGEPVHPEVHNGGTSIRPMDCLLTIIPRSGFGNSRLVLTKQLIFFIRESSDSEKDQKSPNELQNIWSWSDLKQHCSLFTVCCRSLVCSVRDLQFLNLSILRLPSMGYFEPLCPVLFWARVKALQQALLCRLIQTSARTHWHTVFSVCSCSAFLFLVKLKEH